MMNIDEHWRTMSGGMLMFVKHLRKFKRWHGSVLALGYHNLGQVARKSYILWGHWFWLANSPGPPSTFLSYLHDVTQPLKFGEEQKPSPNVPNLKISSGGESQSNSPMSAAPPTVDSKSLFRPTLSLNGPERFHLYVSNVFRNERYGGYSMI